MIRKFFFTICVIAIGMAMNTATAQTREQPQNKYVPGENFPTDGYLISTSVITYNGDILETLRSGRLTLHKIPDNDTLYYLRLIPKEEKLNYDYKYFYFLLLNEDMKNDILDHTLNKEKYKMKERVMWMDKMILELCNTQNKTNCWTKYNRKVKALGQQLQRSYQPFTLQEAVLASRQKEDVAKAVVELLLITKTFLKGSGNGNYSCGSCGQSFSSHDALRQHENSVHDY